MFDKDSDQTSSEKAIETKVFEFLNSIYFKNPSPSKDPNGNEVPNY